MVEAIGGEKASSLIIANANHAIDDPDCQKEFLEGLDKFIQNL